jgi:hypothetical protein
MCERHGRVRCHQLCAQHAFDLVGWLERLKADDRDDELPVAIFIRLAFM